MWKTFYKAKTSPSEFKVTTPKNPLINTQAVTSLRNLTLPSPIPKYQPTVEPSLQYPIRLDAFFPLMHKSPICD